MNVRSVMSVMSAESVAFAESVSVLSAPVVLARRVAVAVAGSSRFPVEPGQIQADHISSSKDRTRIWGALNLAHRQV